MSKKILTIMVSFIIFATFLMSNCMPASATSNETNWLQAGVRLWYCGGIDSSSGGASSNILEAYTVKSVNTGSATITYTTGMNNWTVNTNSTNIICPNPSEEGSFWISPKRLNALKKGGDISWLGHQYIVYARTNYTYNSSALPYGNLPFMPMLPILGLFDTSGNTRDIITLTDNQGNYAGRFYFDVKTGILLSKTTASVGSGAMLTLSEINYNFATGRSAPEDNGPHTGIANHTIMAQLYNLSSSGYELFSQCVSRYDNVFCFANNGTLVNNGTTVPIPSSNVFYDMKTNKTVQQQSGSTKLVDVGNYFYWWVPTSALQKSSLNIWGTNLSKRSNSLTFSSASDPTDFGWSSVTFDSDGYLQDSILVCKSVGIKIDSTFAKKSLPTNCKNQFLGLNFYKNNMGQAKPSGTPLDLSSNQQDNGKTVASKTSQNGKTSVNGTLGSISSKNTASTQAVNSSSQSESSNSQITNNSAGGSVSEQNASTAPKKPGFPVPMVITISIVSLGAISAVAFFIITKFKLFKI